LDFSTVKKLEPPKLQAASPKILKLHEGLLDKPVGIVAVVTIRNVIGPSQTKLTLRRGNDRIARQSKNSCLSGLQLPFETITCLPDGYPE
jgi:hypothetical protein